MRLFHNKKGGWHVMLAIAIAAAVLLVFLGIAYKIGLFSSQSSDVTKCKGTMLANSDVRGITKGEQIPIKCPQRPDLVIKYSDVKGSNSAAIQYNIMRVFADNMVTCFQKTLGDTPSIKPFPNDEGIFCVVDRRISFDKSIKNDKDIGTIDNFMTYLINMRMVGTTKTYAEYLYGYKKKTDGKETYDDMVTNFLTSQQSDPSVAKKLDDIKGKSNLDISLDKNKDYYVVQVFVKGIPYFKKFTNQVEATSTWLTVSSCAAAIASGAAAFTGVGATVAVPGVQFFGTACIAGIIYKVRQTSEKDQMRFTAVIPVDQFDDLGCTETYS